MRRTCPDIERILNRLDVSDCWEWTLRTSSGYGLATVGSLTDGTRRTVHVHRFVYEGLVGAIPEGAQLDHLCRNRKCANPDHLEPVSPRMNTLRGNGATARHAKKTHCIRGHSLSDAYIHRGGRYCRICRSLRSKGLI